MSKLKLTKKQAINAIKVFLNTFELILDARELSENLKTINIIDSNNNIVGKVIIYDDYFQIEVKTDNYILNAKHTIPNVFGIVERANNKEKKGVFGSWTNKISFDLESKEAKIKGEFLLSCTTDNEYGISCLCHPSLHYENKEGKKTIINFFKNSRMFSYEEFTDGYQEKIYVMPFDNLNGYILHSIAKGNYDFEKGNYPYKKYAGVFSCGETNKDDLHVYLTEEKFGEEIETKNKVLPKVSSGTYSEVIKQIGALFQNLDYTMVQKIEEIRKFFLQLGIPLFDNLVGVCFDRFSADEVKSLLGIDLLPIKYQNGGMSLKDAYFEIGINNSFFPSDVQKRILENKKD